MAEPTPPIPLLMPTLDGPIYYVVGFDTVLKSYPLTQNPLWSTTVNQCQSQALSYSIRMQNGLALPRFISLSRSPTLEIQANVPVATEIGTYLL